MGWAAAAAAGGGHQPTRPSSFESVEKESTIEYDIAKWREEKCCEMAGSKSVAIETMTDAGASYRCKAAAMTESGLERAMKERSID